MDAAPFRRLRASPPLRMPLAAEALDLGDRIGKGDPTNPPAIGKLTPRAGQLKRLLELVRYVDDLLDGDAERIRSLPSLLKRDGRPCGQVRGDQARGVRPRRR